MSVELSKNLVLCKEEGKKAIFILCKVYHNQKREVNSEIILLNDLILNTLHVANVLVNVVVVSVS